jgi:phage shock protein C
MSERLYRSIDDRMIAGVASGLADRLDVDPSVVRIIWAVLVPVTGFIALVVYVVMAVIVPSEDDLAPADRWAPAFGGGWPAGSPGPVPGSSQAAAAGASAPPPGPPAWSPSAMPAPQGGATPGTAAWPIGAQPGPAPSGALGTGGLARPGAAQPGVAWPVGGARPGAPGPGTASTATPPSMGGPMPPPLPPGPPQATAPYPPSGFAASGSLRSERRARRAGRRAERAPGSAGLVVGGVLILTGVWFLVREFVPELEPSRFWPVALVGLGVVLLLVALSRRSGGTGGDGR